MEAKMIRRINNTSIVNAGVMNDITNYPAIPAKTTITITSFGAADINMGDNKSSAWVLQWGSSGSFETVRIISLTGDTHTEKMKYPLIGDGVKYLRVVRRNYSGSNKELPFWIEGEQA
jgi:hypothetical protein